MTQPRPVVPGRSYLLTRRCAFGQMVMRPDDETNRAFLYCLSVSARKFGVDVHFTLAMSNHHHTGIHDRRGNYPAFLAYFHRLLAVCQNALRRRRENVWSVEQTNVVHLVDPEDVFEKMVYAITNPVKDHLVGGAHHWPGASSLGCILQGRPVVVRRPSFFFRPDRWQDEETLEFSPFPGVPPADRDRWVARLRERIREAELAAAQVRQITKQRIVGRRAIRQASWRTCADHPERSREGKPTVAAADRAARRETLLLLRVFRSEYSAAREAFRRGDRNAIFPAGTYALRRIYDVRCAPS